MSSLVKMMSDLAELERDIIDSGGEDNEEYDILKEITKNKAANVATFLSSKRIEDNIGKLKKYKEEISNEIKKLERRKAILRSALHYYVKEYGIVKTNEPIGRYAIPDYSIRRKINISKLPIEDTKYEISVKTDGENLEKITGILRKYGIEYTLKDITKVTDLPENHPAIIKEIIPTIKFVKNLPKEK